MRKLCIRGCVPTEEQVHQMRELMDIREAIGMTLGPIAWVCGCNAEIQSYDPDLLVGRKESA